MEVVMTRIYGIRTTLNIHLSHGPLKGYPQEPPSSRVRFSAHAPSAPKNSSELPPRQSRRANHNFRKSFPFRMAAS